MMKKYSLIAALVIALTFAFVGCSGTLDDGGNGGGGGALEEKVIFDMQDSAKGTVTHGIQELADGALTFTDDPADGNPMKPLVRAGGNTDVTIEAAKTAGKVALKVSSSNTWGPGIDLPNAAFGFREGDKITIKGEVTNINGGKVDLNFKLGAQSAHGVPDISANGAINFEVELTAAMLSDIRGGSPAALRIEGRAASASAAVAFRIDDIKIVGMRPSTIAKLAAPAITLTGSTISWTAVPGAGGYKVFALEEGGTTPDEVTSLVSETSYNLATSDLDPGDYTVTVVALGVAGSSTDSDPSNAVAFTKQPPVPVSVTFTAGMIETGGKGTVEKHATLNGYTYTYATTGADIDYGNGYAVFKFDLGEALSNFNKLNFTFNGEAGGFTWKAVLVKASETAISGYNGGSATIIFPSTTNTVGAGVDQEISLALDTDAAADLTGTELYFAIIVPCGTDVSYTIYDVEFVK